MCGGKSWNRAQRAVRAMMSEQQIAVDLFSVLLQSAIKIM